ncbi:MAG: hypothetical protein N3A38_00345 [Planctomycetota bacterium]|nr:hypothetical protein [Planctomycetota bacterium]
MPGYPSPVPVLATLAWLAFCGAGIAGEDFMTRAVRDTIEGDARGYVRHMFPKEEVVSLETLPTAEKFKDIHTRKIAVGMTNDVKVEMTITARVNRQNTGGLPYTIEVLKVSDLKCFRQGKPALPEGAAKALEEAKEAVGEAARKAALDAYPGEKVESSSVSDPAGEHDRRSYKAAVVMTNGIKVEMDVVAGYAYDPKTNTIKAEVVGFARVSCTKDGKPDTPANPVKTIGVDSR